MKVAFLGLGNMGAPIARHILDAGFELRVYNRTAAKAKPLINAGATASDTPAGAAADADVIITMLADDHALETVVFGEDGLFNALADNAMHISMSTISVEMAQRLSHRHAEAGHRFLSAPVFGRPDAAEAKKLWVLAGGTEDDIAHVRPLLEACGQGILETGTDPSSANVIKLAGNYTIAAMMETLGEAFALVRKSGISAQSFLDIVNGHVFRSPVYENYGGQIAAEEFEPAGFKLSLGLKDMRLVLAAAESAQAPMPLASLLHDRYLGAAARGLGDLDWSAVGRLSADDAGLRPVDN